MTISAIFSDDFPDLFSVARVPSKTGSRHRQITICPLLQLWQTVNPNQALPRKFCSVFLQTFETVSTEILLPGILYKGLTCWRHVSQWSHTYFSGAVVVMAPCQCDVLSTFTSPVATVSTPHSTFTGSFNGPIVQQCPAAPPPQPWRVSRGKTGHKVGLCETSLHCSLSLSLPSLNQPDRTCFFKTLH